MRSVYDVIRRPIISEKSTALAEVGNRYAFEVATQANKQEIRDAVQRLFNVKVRKVAHDGHARKSEACRPFRNEALQLEESARDPG